MPTTYSTRTIPTTSYTARPSFISNTVEPIITGFWNDLFTWNETEKFWNDGGNTSAIYTSRIIP